jgi:hypothetical protein
MLKTTSTTARAFLLLQALLLGACGEAPVPDQGSAGADSGMPAAGGSAPATPAARPRNPECTAPNGVSNAPATIAETLTLINALPKPVTLPCFLQSLARPLAIHATNSLFSLQPAQGARSPRIFVFARSMVMSIVPAGDTANFLEFGETRADFRSLKAELAFPVSAALPPSAPFDDLRFNDQLSKCAVCHANEIDESTTLGVRLYVSGAIRPLPADRVPAARLAQELVVCDSSSEPQRCAMLDALLGWGPVSDADFDPAMPTFFR